MRPCAIKQVLPRPVAWAPTLDSDRNSDAQSTWINGALIFTDLTGDYAYVASPKRDLKP